MLTLFRGSSRTSRVARRPYERERMDHEIQLVGGYGLRNKRELWRVHYTLARLLKVARELLTLDPKETRREFEESTLIRRLQTMNVLGLQARDLLDRRLQTVITTQVRLAHTVHEARALIYHRHISVGDQLDSILSFMVRTDSGRHVRFHATSSRAPDAENLGRVKRRKAKRGRAAPDE